MAEPDIPPKPAPRNDPSLLDRDMADIARRNPGRFWLALAIAAGLVLTGLSAWRQGWFTPTVHLYVELQGAAGVQIGTPVKLKGFKIGEIDNIDLEPTLNVRVRMRVVQERLKLMSRGASAKFGRDGPISGKFIDIIPGTLEGQRMEAEATLPMDSGNELEDVMGTVKVAIEKLSSAIAKVEPILDDTKKLTGEAAEMRKDVRSSVSALLANMETMSSQFKGAGTSAAKVAGNLDKDRAAIVNDLKKVLAQADQAATSARATLQALEKDLPPITATTKAALDNAQAATDNVKTATESAKAAVGDVRQVVKEAGQDIPPALRSARAAAQDATEITSGVKNLWPLSSVVKPAPEANLPLDSFEGQSK
jgi:phospholipid/cholesterol/gamma-HCH transport system substrate-binding protein